MVMKRTCLPGRLANLVGNKREQRDVPGPLDSLHYHALMAGAGTGYSAWDDLASLGDELGSEPSEYHLFVIYGSRFVDAKHTDFAARLAKFTWLTARFAG